MTTVTFHYDEETRKWEVTVDGVLNELEARQAFSAVVLTCQELNAGLLTLTKTVPLIKIGIIPAI